MRGIHATKKERNPSVRTTKAHMRTLGASIQPQSAVCAKLPLNGNSTTKGGNANFRSMHENSTIRGKQLSVITTVPFFVCQVHSNNTNHSLLAAASLDASFLSRIRLGLAWLVCRHVATSTLALGMAGGFTALPQPAVATATGLGPGGVVVQVQSLGALGLSKAPLDRWCRRWQRCPASASSLHSALFIGRGI